MRMETLLDLYAQPHDSHQPVLCLDERPCQLLADKEPPLPMQPGQPAKEDYQDDRQGTCCLFVAVEPLTGFRFVQVRKQRTKADYAEFLRAVVTLPQYAACQQIRLVQDNLNTHTAGALYETFDAEIARQLTRRVVSYPTPKHASWLNMAEIELAALSKQCLDRRLATQDELEHEVAACVRERNAQQVKITWRFTTTDARDKLKRHYETIKK